MTTTDSTGKTTYATPLPEEIVITRVVDAPPDLVFRVHTEPEHLRNWMLGPPGWTMPVCEVDLRVGGTYRCVWRQDDGAEMVISGEYREISRPDRLVSSETWKGWPAVLNTMDLAESDGRTTITTTMRYPSEEHRDNALRTGMAEGMGQSYLTLDTYLATVTE